MKSAKTDTLAYGETDREISTASHMLTGSLDEPAAPPGRQEQEISLPGGGAFISVAPHEPLVAGPNRVPFESTTSEYGIRGKEAIKGTTDEDAPPPFINPAEYAGWQHAPRKL